MERTRGPGMKPLGLQRPLRIAATFSELLLSLSPTKRDPRTIYLAEYNLGSQTRHNYTKPFFSMPALSSLADIVRPVFSTQKISSPNHLQSPPQGSAVGFNKGAPIPKGHRYLVPISERQKYENLYPQSAGNKGSQHWSLSKASSLKFSSWDSSGAAPNSTPKGGLSHSARWGLVPLDCFQG